MIARRPCPVLLLVAALALVACDDEGHGNVKTGFGDDMGQVGEDARPDEPIDRSDADPDGTGLGGDEGPRETDDQGVPPDVRDMAPDMLDAEPPEDDADTEPPDRGDMDASGPDGCEPGAVMRCGEGECPGGVKHCTADGRFGECEPPPELCGDNADNDCDGRVDETLVGNAVPCHVGVGGCARDGVLYCAGGFVECSAQPGDASEEVCNGIDDDCDEATDEGVGGNVPCAFGDGICRARGLTICDAGGNVYCPAEAG
ncbi:MAG: hypothetical protein KC620_20605, partial [Myxococcales bacterium]|nr:hypothetical protein [Myxococcales bacterium]